MNTARRLGFFALAGASVLVGGCSSMQPRQEPAPAPADTYDVAMAALEDGDRERGRAALQDVLELCGTTALGERAAVALMAEALDPRHLNPDYAAQLAREYLSQPYRTQWVEQLATTAYLVALNYGARVDTAPVEFRSASTDEFPKECRSGGPEPSVRDPATIPKLPAQATASRVTELERAVAELRAELERVRETLRP